MTMEINISINQEVVETIKITNRGPYDKDPRLVVYTWHSSLGRVGVIGHPPNAGAAGLGAAVMMDRSTRQPNDKALFVIAAIDAEDTDTNELQRLYDGEEAAKAVDS